MNNYNLESHLDYGPEPYVTNVENKAMYNRNFRTAIWTGCHGQMTLMCIPVCSDIGIEIHEDTDQFIRVEHGIALVKMGKCKDILTFQTKALKGDTIFVPSGTWHNIINAGQTPLKLSSIYTPPHHPRGTIHHTKSDSERTDY